LRCEDRSNWTHITDKRWELDLGTLYYLVMTLDVVFGPPRGVDLDAISAFLIVTTTAPAA
jgi:hypothetical protein